MSDTETLRIRIKSSFKELPDELSLSYSVIEASALSYPDSLFDEKTAVKPEDHVNVLVPLIVLPDKNGTNRIIDGCKRFIACKEEKRGSVPCQVISEPLDQVAAGLLRIVLNQVRPLHLREAFLFHTWLKETIPADKLSQIEGGLGFKSKQTVKYEILRSMSDQVKEAFLSGFLDMALVDSFRIFPEEDQLNFLKTFKGFSLSFQIQREFLEWLPEIGYTKNIAIKEILSQRSITETISNTTLNAPQKLQKIRSLLYVQKFPRLSDAEKEWKELAGKNNPDRSCVSFEHNPYFEKNRLEISISLTKAEKATNIFNRLSEIPPKTWKKLIYPL